MPSPRGALALSCLLVASAALTQGCDPMEIALLGGDTTVASTSDKAFTFPAANLGEFDGEGRRLGDAGFDAASATDRARRFHLGNSFFNKNWVVAGSDTSRDGLGPLFNARSCSACHLKDGRGVAPVEGEAFLGVLLRLSLPGAGPHGEPRGLPAYGDQLQDRSGLEGIPPEGRPVVTWREVPGSYPDGSPYTLRAPLFEITELAYGPLGDDVMISPRIAPGMAGLGLLEAVPEAHIRRMADPEDLDGDGISGRTNRVWDAEAGAHRLGRFGWKANQPSIRQQVAGAMMGDMGLSTPLFGEGPCTAAQPECDAAPDATDGVNPEVPEDTLAKVVFYSALLAVPEQRGGGDGAVRRGQALFGDVGCARCHVPTLVTGADAPHPEVANQLIHPFTDLLLHDMGAALADGRPDFDATGAEWRTPPLWGLGLYGVVAGSRDLLHDGRARSPEEAILWHGGEGEAAREAFRALSAAERADLLTFLDSI